MNDLIESWGTVLVTTQHGAIEGKTQTNETVTICNKLEYYCVNNAV